MLRTKVWFEKVKEIIFGKNKIKVHFYVTKYTMWEAQCPKNTLGSLQFRGSKSRHCKYFGLVSFSNSFLPTETGG